METIFMKTENDKANKPHKKFQNHTQKVQINMLLFKT